MLIIRKAVLDLETLQWISIDGYFKECSVELCCGATSQQNQLEGQQANLSSELASDFAQRFAGQDATLSQLNNILGNVQQGKLLPGFSPQTQAALQSQAIDTASANAKNVTQALNVANAGRGGDSGLQPGIVGQEAATALTGVANQEAAQQQNISIANQQQAEQNTAMALGGYNQLASQQAPLGFGNEAIGGGQSAYGMATENAQIGAQEFGDIAGGIAGLGMAGAKIYQSLNPSNPGSGGSGNSDIPTNSGGGGGGSDYD